MKEIVKAFSAGRLRAWVEEQRGVGRHKMTPSQRAEFDSVFQSREPETFMLGWNPEKWLWDINETRLLMKDVGYYIDHWTCVNTKVRVGDKFILSVQGGTYAGGIIASGECIGPHFKAEALPVLAQSERTAANMNSTCSPPVKKSRWQREHGITPKPKDFRPCAMFRFDVLLPMNDVLPVQKLKDAHVKFFCQGSGEIIHPADAGVIERLWSEHLKTVGVKTLAAKAGR